MGLKRDVSLKDALRYQGKGPMLTYILHRIGGLGMVTFVGLHVLASFMGGRLGIPSISFTKTGSSRLSSSSVSCST